MTEKDYIAATNRVKVSMAIYAIKDLLPGFDGVIEDEDRVRVIKQLYEWEDKLFKIIDNMED